MKRADTLLIGSVVATCATLVGVVSLGWPPSVFTAPSDPLSAAASTQALAANPVPLLVVGSGLGFVVGTAVGIRLAYRAEVMA